MKLGSLFDGSGGFPLAGSLCGIEPVWAAEVEPYPIAVTRSRFPNMKHLGDISKVDGAEIEPVDIITFGSPCQDLSVAGKRAGIKHIEAGDDETTRSGLFMEAVRIIKEMRAATNGKYPRFALWENVPGAFSSNKGEDFRIVCEELIKIVEPSAVMPGVPEKGWAYADSFRGDGWSLAYRVFDAQYWGVPQRRRRIHLIIDFASERAGEILFKREGVRGYFAEGGAPWQGAAADAERSFGADDREGIGVMSFVDSHILDDQGGQQIGVRTDGKSPALRAEMHGNVPCVMQAAGFKANQGAKAGGIGWQEETACTLNADCPGLEPTVCAKVYDARGNGDGETVPTITGDHERRATDYTAVLVEEDATVYCLQGNGIDRADTAVCYPINTMIATRHKQLGRGTGFGVGENGDAQFTLSAAHSHTVCYAMQAFGKYTESDIASAMKARDYKDATDLVCECAGVDCRNMNEYPELYPTLQAKPNGGQSLNFSGAVRVRYIVRRLTPTECARLQGFPDNWGHPDHKADFSNEEYRFWMEVRNTHAAINGKAVKEYTKEQMLKWYNKLHTDSAEYKMWGNGIALPPALYCMQGIVEAMNREEDDSWLM